VDAEAVPPVVHVAMTQPAVESQAPRQHRSRSAVAHGHGVVAPGGHSHELALLEQLCFPQPLQPLRPLQPLQPLHTHAGDFVGEAGLQAALQPLQALQPPSLSPHLSSRPLSFFPSPQRGGAGGGEGGGGGGAAGGYVLSTQLCYTSDAALPGEEEVGGGPGRGGAAGRPPHPPPPRAPPQGMVAPEGD
jgi:hypothetical protein